LAPLGEGRTWHRSAGIACRRHDGSALSQLVGDLAALAALGVYAELPSERDLAEQAFTVGGEPVLAAILANALFGAAIGLGMLAEGRMLELGIKPGERLSLARAQALRASGAEGPGFVGVLHWQAAQLAWPLRPLKDGEEAPLGRALAACSWALVSMLQAMAMAEPSGSRANQVADALATAREELAAAQRRLDALDEQMADLAGDLASVIAAAHDAMRAQGNGDVE
jgi:hypothetical protein